MATKTLATAKRKGPLSAMSFKTRQAGREGALHRALGIPQEQKIPTSTLRAKARVLSKRAEGEKRLSAADLRMSRMVQAALRYRGA